MRFRVTVERHTVTVVYVEAPATQDAENLAQELADSGHHGVSNVADTASVDAQAVQEFPQGVSVWHVGGLTR